MHKCPKKWDQYTLVALVITIIILLILAGITISQLTGSGLFENAKLAEQKSKEAQEKEDATLADYANKINSYVDGTRETSSKIKSLINTEDALYNKTEGGYVFDTPTTAQTITSNNVINLTENIENYDYIVFEIDMYRAYSSGYTFPNTFMISSTRIKSNYSETYDINKTFLITNSLGDNWNRIFTTFKDNSTILIHESRSSYEYFTKLRITDIKGIKY